MALLLTLCSQYAFAQEDGFSLKKLMMPGKVIQGHAKWEHQCTACHEELNNEAQNTLCLDCHTEIQQDIDQQQGFHGTSPLVSGGECRSCHSEHKGRDADITGLDKDHFNHDTTNFPLTGLHSDLACDSCHFTNVPFRKAENQCADCHADDDIHKGAFTQPCSDCHSTSGWAKNAFDHNTTDFPLKGKHEQVSCNQCHPDQQYTSTPTQCSQCHSIDDTHQGMNGPKCERCHSEQAWKKTTFDHNRDTDYALHGKHENVTCNACHLQPVYEHKPGDTCISCHQTDDVHRQSNGTECQSCHVVDGWRKVKFDHNTDTDFALSGAHKSARCKSCHRLGQEAKNTPSRCIDCHQQNDVHEGQLGTQCNQCHTDTAWLDDIRFNHELTAFPLIGMHAFTACDSCHLSQRFEPLKTECVSCHQQDDAHQQTLGNQCESCHNPNDWLVWQFDHNTQTDFALTGAHDGLVCSGCHTQPAKDNNLKINQACVSCHADDDAHDGRFGRQCQQCHNSESFEKVKVH